MAERLERKTDLRLGNRNAETHDIRSEGDLIVIRLRAGDYFKTACARAGVPHSTAKRWLRLGRAGLGNTWGNYTCREEHVWFYEMVEYSLAEVEGYAVDHWMGAIRQGNWQAARDFLARRFPHQWGRSTRREAELPVDDEGLTDRDLISDELGEVSSEAADQADGVGVSFASTPAIQELSDEVSIPPETPPASQIMNAESYSASGAIAEDAPTSATPALRDTGPRSEVRISRIADTLATDDPFILPPTVVRLEDRTVFLDRPTPAEPFPIRMNRVKGKQDCRELASPPVPLTPNPSPADGRGESMAARC